MNGAIPMTTVSAIGIGIERERGRRGGLHLVTDEDEARARDEEDARA